MSRSLRPFAWFVASPFALLVLASAAPARANDPAAAQALFTDAKQLLAQGKYAEACPKLEESERLDPGIGTLFHLADCNQHLGKTATAWADYLEVAAEAKAKGETARERVARDRAAALEPLLARMAITVGPAQALPGLEVRRDGVVVGKGQWGTPVPVDPGEHVVVASAPGRRTWQQRVRIDPRGRTTIDLPTLEQVPGAVAQTEAQPAAAAPIDGHAGTTQTTSATVPSDTSDGSTRRAIGLAIGAAGIVGLGVGTYFGIASKSNHDDSAAHCNGNLCDATGVSMRDDAIRDGNVSTVALGVGAAALIGGAVLFFTAPREGSPAPSAQTPARPTIGVGPRGVTVAGTF